MALSGDVCLLLEQLLQPLDTRELLYEVLATPELCRLGSTCTELRRSTNAWLRLRCAGPTTADGRAGVQVPPLRWWVGCSWAHHPPPPLLTLAAGVYDLADGAPLLLRRRNTALAGAVGAHVEIRRGVAAQGVVWVNAKGVSIENVTVICEADDDHGSVNCFADGSAVVRQCKLKGSAFSALTVRVR